MYIDPDNHLCNGSPLFVATYLGQCKIAKYLLQCVAEINNPNEMGVTPLMTAIQNEDFCRYLLIEKIDVIDLNVKVIKGLTALDYAVNCHSFNTAVLLLENGAVSFAFDFILNVAFHLAKCSHSWSDKKKIDILNKFSESSYFNKINIPDVWELLCVGLFDRNLKVNCLEKAVKIRESKNIIKSVLPYNDSFYYKYDAECKNYNHAQFVSILGREQQHEEFKNYLDLSNIINDTQSLSLKFKIQEAFICERLIPQYGCLYISRLLEISNLLNNDEKRLHLLCYPLRFCSKNKETTTKTTSVFRMYLSLFFLFFFFLSL